MKTDEHAKMLLPITNQFTTRIKKASTYWEKMNRKKNKVR